MRKTCIATRGLWLWRVMKCPQYFRWASSSCMMLLSCHLFRCLLLCWHAAKYGILLLVLAMHTFFWHSAVLLLSLLQSQQAGVSCVHRLSGQVFQLIDQHSLHSPKTTSCCYQRSFHGNTWPVKLAVGWTTAARGALASDSNSQDAWSKSACDCRTHQIHLWHSVVCWTTLQHEKSV